jgi:hypothetical protein
MQDVVRWGVWPWRHICCTITPAGPPRDRRPATQPQARHVTAAAPRLHPQVYSVKEGNAALASRLLAAAGAQLHRSWAVASVGRDPRGGYQLRMRRPPGAAGSSGAGQARAEAQGGAEEPEVAGPFDAVLVAAPLETSGLDVSEVAVQQVPARRYQTTVTTMVEADGLDAAYFGVRRRAWGAWGAWGTGAWWGARRRTGGVGCEGGLAGVCAWRWRARKWRAHHAGACLQQRAVAGLHVAQQAWFVARVQGKPRFVAFKL